MTHELHCYDYVNHPYEQVRTAALADPKALFQRATATASNPELHVKLGALDIGAEITIVIHKIDDVREPFERPSTQLSLEWKSARNPAMFPVLTGKLSIYALTPTETQLELSGSYAPPLGVVGAAIDAVALHRVAEASVLRFVRDLAECLRKELSQGVEHRSA